MPANYVILISLINISPAQFSYELPPEKIAVFPAERRDDARLLIRDTTGLLHEDIFKNIAGYLPDGGRMFLNNSRVIPARLILNTASGSIVEIFCLKPVEPADYQAALGSCKECTWECMIGNAKKFKEPELYLKVNAPEGQTILCAKKIDQQGNAARIHFSWDNPGLSFGEILASVGITPLPPYIKRDPVPDDREWYQTIYSKTEGSVAAPTAGLHFTDEVIDSLDKKRITRHEVTLHVGAGTFQPIKTEQVRDHKMHAEFFELNSQLMRELADMNEKVTCVGTTTVRTLESMYWLGAKLLRLAEVPDVLHLDQWEPYSLEECPVDEAFHALLEWLNKKAISTTMASTSFMIVPGYRFKITERLITNFHQPRSTLLMLIAAFIGDSWKATYQYALENGFRFLSYGDSSLLFNPHR